MSSRSSPPPPGPASSDGSSTCSYTAEPCVRRNSQIAFTSLSETQEPCTRIWRLCPGGTKIMSPRPRSCSAPLASSTVRESTFDEVQGGLDAHNALFEARRCLSCGNCFECDGCLGACPEDAVIKLGVGHRYRFDLDRCTGCAVCFEQCPVHAIEMVAEPD